MPAIAAGSNGDKFFAKSNFSVANFNSVFETENSNIAAIASKIQLFIFFTAVNHEANGAPPHRVVHVDAHEARLTFAHDAH